MINPQASDIFAQVDIKGLLSNLAKNSVSGYFNYGTLTYLPVFSNPTIAPIQINKQYGRGQVPEYFDFSGWLQAANDSAREMMLERTQRLQLSGNDPLTAQQVSRNYGIDKFYSLYQFINDDYAVMMGNPNLAIDVRNVMLGTQSLGNIVAWSLAGPPIVPYSQEERGAAEFVRNGRLAILRAAQAKVVVQAVQSGQSTGNAEYDLAVASVKKDLTNSIAADQTLPVIGQTNVNIAATLDPQRITDLARQSIQGIANQTVRFTDAQIAFIANLLDYWKKNTPTVELRPQDNPQLPAGAFLANWANQKNPPLVNVRVTPKLKPMPTLGFWGKYGAIVGLVVSLIPGLGVIGIAASQVIKAQTKMSIQQFKNAWEVPTSYFEPSYKPEPFFIVLNLAQAQAAIKQPWYVPMLSYKVRDESGGLYNPFK